MLLKEFSTVIISTLFLAVSGTVSANEYYPPRGEWEQRAPAEMGFDPRALQAAVQWAREQAETEPAELSQSINAAFSEEPGFRILGPTRPREGDSGMIIKDGYVVAQWGDRQRADMTFSVAKSYLSTMAAIALDDERILDLHDRVGPYVQTGHFESEHNRPITWHHLLQQTSDWSGTLWDTPDWADRPETNDPENREMHEPGSHFKYNDVRVNLLAYSLMQVLREPLPRVLRTRIMDPIGASPTWRWHGYENSWVTLDGRRMQSVSGGGHFGGGMFINTEDHARFGLLFEREGNWDGEQLFSASWIDQLTQPTTVRRDYGYMWWLNTDRERIPAAPESAFWAAGFGGNYIYVDRENDLVIVLRWIPELAGVVTRVMDAMAD